MFSNQKKSIWKSKVLYGCIIAMLIAFGIWLNYDGEEEEEEGQQTNLRTKVEETIPGEAHTQEPMIVDSIDDGGSGSGSSFDDDGGKGNLQEIPETQETQEEIKGSESGAETRKASYLVREVDGVVKVFHCSETGEESLYEITSVPFSLLSNEDQQLFAEGVRLEDKTELESFLENFDS